MNHFSSHEIFLFPRLAAVGMFFLLTSCQPKPACPVMVGTPKYLELDPDEFIPELSPFVETTPAEIEINNRWIEVDRVIDGPLCNDHLAGVVYIGCNVQVLEWKDQPLFFEGCDFSVEPGSIVYVADHNNAPYYNGCSCHTGEDPAHQTLSPN